MLRIKLTNQSEIAQKANNIKYEFDKKTTQFVFYSGGGEAKHAIKQITKLGFEKEAIVLKQPLSNKEEAKEKLKGIL